ncbi:MAG: tRNA (adenosine(37)-N6)-threonylcarbamoyltransferase complex dimerization subunit type 1 TsaB [Bacteriovoracaceae bacterium]
MILAIETATEVCSAALVDHQTVIAVRSQHEKNIHSERLLSLIDDVFSAAGIGRTAIDAVAVSIGPGSFTGLRIGLSAAKGLALALDVPLIAVPTLDGIAEAYRSARKSSDPDIFCAMIDAKREEAFYAFYKIDRDEIVRNGEFAIIIKSDILAEASMTGAVALQPEISAACIGLLADRRKKEFTLHNFSTAEPLYLRDFVATIPKNKV